MDQISERIVGLTEYRKNLSKYLKCVEDGEVIMISRHRKLIDSMIPEKVFLEGKMAELVRRGVLHWGGKTLSSWKPHVVNNGPELISDLVLEERRKR